MNPRHSAFLAGEWPSRSLWSSVWLGLAILLAHLVIIAQFFLPVAASADEPISPDDPVEQIQIRSNVRIDRPDANSVADLRARNDENLLRDLVAYIDQNPKANDLDDAYLLIFEIGIAYDWFDRTEPMARRYLKEHPGGDVATMAKVLATMADIAAGRFREALITYKELLADLGDPEQLAFALDFADTLAANALATDDPGTAREVYVTLRDRYGNDPEIEQRIEGDLARIARLGTPAPLIEATDIKGQTVHLSDFLGRHVLVFFWAAWSPPCVEELAAFRDAHARHREKGLEIIAISLDPTREGLAEFLQDQGLDWVHIHASTCGVDWVEAFGVNSIPSTFLLNPEGVITRLGLRGKTLDQLFRTIEPAE